MKMYNFNSQSHSYKTVFEKCLAQGHHGRLEWSGILTTNFSVTSEPQSADNDNGSLYWWSWLTHQTPAGFTRSSRSPSAGTVRVSGTAAWRRWWWAHSAAEPADQEEEQRNLVMMEVMGVCVCVILLSSQTVESLTLAEAFPSSSITVAMEAWRWSDLRRQRKHMLFYGGRLLWQWTGLRSFTSFWFHTHSWWHHW